MQFHHHGYVSGEPRVLPAAGTGIDRPADLPDEMDVLIVGSGPAGMLLAAQMAQFPDVTTRIIERRDSRLVLGQADGIQPRSVETFQAFGFAERDELDTFVLLLSVSGVGPKSALGVLSALSVDQISQAVADEDDAPFRRVSGIGPKTAKLIVVQLAGKLRAPAARDAVSVGGVAPTAIAAQVVAALVALGWNERTSAEAVQEISAAAGAADRASVPALLKLALAQLGPARTERTSV